MTHATTTTCSVFERLAARAIAAQQLRELRARFEELEPHLRRAVLQALTTSFVRASLREDALDEELRGELLELILLGCDERQVAA